MIERYTLPEMGAIWSDENRYRKWLEIELAVCEAWEQLGRIPPSSLRQIKEKAIHRLRHTSRSSKLRDYLG